MSKWFNDSRFLGDTAGPKITRKESRESNEAKSYTVDSALDNARWLGRIRWYMLRSMFPLIGIHRPTYAMIMVSRDRVHTGAIFQWEQVFDVSWRSAHAEKCAKRESRRIAATMKRRETIVMKRLFANMCGMFGIDHQLPPEKTSKRMRNRKPDSESYVALCDGRELSKRFKYSGAACKRLPAHLVAVAKHAISQSTDASTFTRWTHKENGHVYEVVKITQ